MGTHLYSLKSNLQTIESKMQLFVQGTNLHNVEVNNEQDLVKFACDVEQAKPEEILLTWNGAPVEFDQLPAEATIEITGKLLGGKVHGSLARAGKVKGQTPKVEPQEKRKPKTGRAKRRMQYNRRFVVQTSAFGGKRKGPNQQQQN